MRKIREILRLKEEAGLSLRQIAASLSISPSTVSQVVEQSRQAGLSWPLPPELSDVELEKKVYGDKRRVNASKTHAEPDYSLIHRELRRRGVTLQLCWHEYRSVHPEGYGYSRFCQLYRRWRGTLEVSMRQYHRAGEKLFVDYAGQTAPVRDPSSGQWRQAQIFVATLGASNYTYAEAAWSQELPHWLQAHCRALEFFGGVPAIVVPDNLRAAVTRSCRYEPDLNRSYRELSEHYGFVIIPARARKPRDKPKVENGVLQVERWILAPLRHRTFFSLSELNTAIRAQLHDVNHRPFQKLEGSRYSLFEELDRPALGDLPQERYTFAPWKLARVNIDHHIMVDDNHYSVPYQLVKEQVDVRLALATLEVFHQGQRVASHARSYAKGHCSTQEEHRPAAHRRYLEWTPSRILQAAESVGTDTARMVSTLLETRPHPEQGYRSCLGLLRLEKRYGPERLEAACVRALGLGAYSYQSVKSILRNGLDAIPGEAAATVPPIEHANLRGAAYYDLKGREPC